MYSFWANTPVFSLRSRQNGSFSRYSDRLNCCSIARRLPGVYWCKLDVIPVYARDYTRDEVRLSRIAYAFWYIDSISASGANVESWWSSKIDPPNCSISSFNVIWLKLIDYSCSTALSLVSSNPLSFRVKLYSYTALVLISLEKSLKMLLALGDLLLSLFRLLDCCHTTKLLEHSALHDYRWMSTGSSYILIC